MVKATVIYTNIDVDSAVVTYHAVIQHENVTTEVYYFNFIYPWNEGPNEEKDHKNIVDTLKRKYGHIEIEFISPLKFKFYNFSYR